MAAAVGPGRGDAVGLFGHLALARVPVVLAAGNLGLPSPDALFWGMLGLLVLVNVQLDLRRSLNRAGARVKARTADAASRWADMRLLAIRGFKTAATFTTIALLWSLWSSPSLTAWLDMMHRGLFGV